MAKVDRKSKDNQQAEKHSLSSFDKKRGAIASFNARTNKNNTNSKSAYRQNPFSAGNAFYSFFRQ